MKNKKKIGLSLKKVQISKLQTSMITGGRAEHFCTEVLATCYPCLSEFRSCADLIK